MAGGLEKRGWSAQDERVACWVFAAIGVGYLFPFSALTQPVDYWHRLFPTFNMDFPITTLYMCSNLVFLGLIVAFGERITASIYTKRMILGFAGQFLVLVSVPVEYYFGLGMYDNYYIILGATAFAALSTALIDACAISLASQFPKSCQEALQLGIGVSTLIGSVYRLLTKAFFPPDDVVPSSHLYFFSGAATVLVCIGMYVYLLRLPITKLCLYGETAPGPAADEVGSVEKTGYGTFLNDGANGDVELETKVGEADARDGTPLLGAPPRERSTPMKPSNRKDDDDASVNKFGVVRKAFFNELMVFVLFASTLCLWPPLVSEIPSFNFPVLNETKWWPLLLLFIFSASDVTGRFLVPYRGFLTKDNIWTVVLARVVLLFPPVVCCARGVVFTNDALSVFFVSLLGLTNGYVGSLTVLFVNEAVDPSESRVAGMMTGFVLNSGLSVGAMAAIPVRDFLVR